MLKPPKRECCPDLPRIAWTHGNRRSHQMAGISRQYVYSAKVSQKSTCKILMEKKHVKCRVRDLQRDLRESRGQRTTSRFYTAQTSISGAFRSPAGNRKCFSSRRMWSRWPLPTLERDSPTRKYAIPETSGNSNWAI